MKNIHTITICIFTCILASCHTSLTENQARDLLRDHHIVPAVAYYNIPAKDPATANNPKVIELVDKGLLKIIPSNDTPEIFFTEKGRVGSLRNADKNPDEKRIRLADIKSIKIDHIADKQEDGQDVTEVTYVLEYGHISAFASLVTQDFTRPEKRSASFARVNNKWEAVKYHTN